jgi:hypothetical protein
MPYKSDKIKIAFTKFDRRIKLTDDDRADIIEKYKSGLYSLRALSREYQVDKKTIKFVVDPEYYKETLEKHRGYEYKTKDGQRASYMRKHRRYKHNLFMEGLISETQ